ncbi:hypothetical protein BX666DRAFT_1899065 [Dichotomocladium elegans]|nr:hypothetical protein BX666DRAFT_1899065 [Dichotomocladium elegans]
MIQRVWDSLKDGTFIDSHSDVQSTTTINSSSPENGARSPLLSPVDTSHYHHHHQLAISSPMTDIRYAEYLQPRATIYQPGARHFVMLSSTIPRSVSADGLPSYLAKIWTLVFEDTNSISAQEANAKNIDRSHPITTRFATMLKSTVPAMSGQQQDDAELKIHHSPSSYSHAVLSQSIPFNEDENNKTMEQSVDSDASDCTGQSSLSSYLFSDEEEPLDLSSESAEEATVMMTYEDQDQSSNSNHYVSDTEEYYSDVTPSENPPMDDEDEDEHEDALIAVLQQTHKHQEQQQLLLHPFSSQENKCSSVISENDIDDEEGTDLTAQNMDDVASALLDSVLDENPVDYRHSDESKNIEMQGGNYDQPGDSIVKYVDGRSSSHSPEVEERAAAAEPIHLQEQDDVTVALEEDESPGTAEEPQTEVPATTKKKKKSKKTKRRGV